MKGKVAMPCPFYFITPVGERAGGRLEKKPSRGELVGLSFHRPVEDRIDYIKSDHAAADHSAGGHGTPQHVRAGELPDCQKARDHGNQDATAGCPERNLRNHAWIEETSFHWSRQFSRIQ